MAMSLEVAREHIEEGHEIDPSLPDKDAKRICSGGVASGLEPPALYLDQWQALEEWLSACWRVLLFDRKYRIRWVEPPQMERYVITMQDRRGTQRVVSTRYAVISKLAYVEKENDEGEGSQPGNDQVSSGDGGVARSL